MFERKDVLDLGCNIGHITLSVARDFGAKSVLGIDIDKNLIGIARKNIKYYANGTPTPKPDRSGEKKRFKKQNCEFFPISMPILYGPIDIPGLDNGKTPPVFPNNVTFKQVRRKPAAASVSISHPSIFLEQLHSGGRFPSDPGTAAVRRHLVSQRHEMDASELGG